MISHLAVKTSAPTAVYRHVIFADAARERRRPLDFGPPLGHERPATSTQGSLAPHERAFVNWLFERAGLQSWHYRQETLARRLPACLRLVRAHSIDAARAAIDNEPLLIGAAISALVIGVSSFFRDASVFHNLEDVVLPALISGQRTLRVWSVGCSDGQELYSVTMLLAEMGWLNRAQLLGTDCRTDAVRHAAAGIYEPGDLSGVKRELLDRYFAPTQDDRWRVESRLRTVVQWRSADVLQVVEPGSWDLILCRNLAMYLECEAATALWEQLKRSLRAGGVLVVGKAERPTVQGLCPLAPCMFRRSRA